MPLTLDGDTKSAIVGYQMGQDFTRHTPSAPRQQHLLNALCRLVRRRGWKRFVTGLLIEPNNAYFPDKIDATVGGVRRLTYRLMVYAGLGALRPVLELASSKPPSWLKHHNGSTIAGWFAGINGRNCMFGLDEQQAFDVDGLVGVLAHEVAHAYRRKHELEVADTDKEERLTDLTTVYLGFGVLTANGCYLYRASADGPSERQAGYLGVQDMCFLLATQAVVMGFDDEEFRSLSKYLGTTQRVMFTASYKLLREHRSELRQRMGIPDDETSWPTPTHPEALPILAALNRFAPMRGDDRRLVPTDDPSPFHHPTFRVRRSRAAFGLLAGILLGLGLIGAGVIPDGFGWLVMVSSPLAGAVVGARFRYHSCSNTKCGTRIPTSAWRCPACRRVIAGTIDHQDQRLEAEERLEAEDRAAVRRVVPLGTKRRD